jgi:hypothetical protein
MIKILAIVDNAGWCWTNTVNDVKYHLPGHDIQIMTKDEFVAQRENLPECDFIWFRGYSNLFMSVGDIDKMPPYVWTMSTGGQRLKQRIDSAESTGKSGHGVIVQCKTAYHEMALAGYENIYMLPNGVNTRLFRPSVQQKELVIGLAANIYGSRGNLKGVSFVEKAVNALGAEIAITCTDDPLPHEEMPAFYQGLRYYAQPSESEGCSNSVMEAMACGVPCLVCDNVGYHGEVCKDGIAHEDGQVIFVKRDTSDIIKVIKTLEENPYLYNRISTNARKFAEAHDWKNMTEKYKAMFDDIIKMIKGGKRKPKKVEIPEKKTAVNKGDRYWVIPIQNFRISGVRFQQGRRAIVNGSMLNNISGLVKVAEKI